MPLSSQKLATQYQQCMHSTPITRSVRVGFDQSLQGIGVGGYLLVQQRVAGLIEDADVEATRVQVDATIMLVGVMVEVHESSPLLCRGAIQLSGLTAGLGRRLNKYQGARADAPYIAPHSLVVKWQRGSFYAKC